MKIQRSLTRDAILAEIQKSSRELGPLRIAAQATGRGGKPGIDALVTIKWEKRTYRFGAAVERLWTPKAIKAVADQAQRAVTGSLWPLVIIPYLSDERLRELEGRAISGIDLCGNGVIVVPGELLVFRSGSPNRFRWETRIKNIYRGTSAFVTRVFLIKAEFPSVSEVLEQIRSLGGEVTLPTVSKVCKSLEEDLIIERGGVLTSGPRALRLVQAEKLLDRLVENYVPPQVRRTLCGKYSGNMDSLAEQLSTWEEETRQKIIRTGASSVDGYAVMAREPVQSFYCSDLAGLRQSLGAAFTETERFPTTRIYETSESTVYFDKRPGLLASPVQTCLELATGDKREKETSRQVRQFILDQLSHAGFAR